MRLGGLSKALVNYASRIFRIFPIKRDKVFFLCFNGTQVGYDQKAFVDWCNENGHKFDFVWGTMDKQNARKMKLKNTRFVPTKSLRGTYEMLTAKTLIYNINPPSYIAFRKKQVLVNTWHGNPIKKIGKYAGYYQKDSIQRSTCMLSHSKFYTDKVIRDSFEYNGQVLECGVPRNDVFFSDNRFEKAQKIKQDLGIADKKIVLYAPTFRVQYSDESSTQEDAIDPASIIDLLNKKTGDDWVFLYRLHPMVKPNVRLSESDDKIDVSKYPDMQDLLLISDIHITDYSSSMLDYCLQGKPVFLLAADLEEYESDRGMYFSLYSLPFPVSRSNDELLDKISSFDEEKYDKALQAYLEETVCYDNGIACKTVYDFIKSH